MTIRMLALLMTGAMLTPLANAQAPQRSTSSADGNCAGVNLLTPEEKAAGWTLLFDGASKGGWHGYNKRDDAGLDRRRLRAENDRHRNKLRQRSATGPGH